MEEPTQKSAKSRRETSVQGTNNSSIVSKCSTSSCGYFDDQFLHHFVAKQTRRAPLIHRGYYIRAMAFDKIFRRFLADNEGKKKQIISLGCGFDSTYFRLKAANLLQDTVFYEIDFPDLVKRKRKLMEYKESLMNLMERKDGVPLSPHIEMSCEDYYLLGVDLTQLNTLEAALKMCGIDFDTPTILFAECVMTYMTRRCSTDVVKWAAETFEDAAFAIYEQMNPDDAFGLFMQRHFHSIGSPLKCINAFPSLDMQEQRFLKSGWSSCEVMDMNTFCYDCLPLDERMRVENLEAFDEYEELNLKYSHYFILVAFTKTPATDYLRLESQLCDNKTSSTTTTAGVTEIEKVPLTNSIRRFGHASSRVNGDYVITTGGFGEVDGRHQRLTDVTVTDMSTMESHHIHCVSPDIQYSRMHHVSVSLSNGSTYLIAGRQSPYFLCTQMLKIDLILKDRTNNSNSNCVSGIPCSSSNDIDNRTREEQESICNQLCQVQVCDSPCAKDAYEGSGSGTQCVTNGVGSDDISDCQSPSVLQCYNCPFGTFKIEVVSQSGDLPSDRWRHAGTAIVVNGEEKIFLHGGKRKNGEIMDDVYLFDPKSNHWCRMSCVGDCPGPRHSHNALFWPSHGCVLLTGGLDHTHTPLNDVHSLDLATGRWERLDIGGSLHARYSHTAQMVKDKLVVIGGVHLSHPPPGMAVIDLATQTAREYSLPTPDSSNLLMLHRVASVPVDSDKILVLGGGGNCFSFGTHLNHTPILVNLSSTLDPVV